MDQRRAPSFRGLTAASPASSHAKRMNQSRDTVQERTLRALLWRSGLRFRKNLASLPGKPDIVFTRRKVAIFCDGDFWHGRHWKQLSKKLRTGANPSYWLHKIEANRQRDRRTDESLRKAGWTVLRFWETDILRDPECIAVEIAKVLRGATN